MIPTTDYNIGRKPGLPLPKKVTDYIPELQVVDPRRTRVNAFFCAFMRNTPPRSIMGLFGIFNLIVHHDRFDSPLKRFYTVPACRSNFQYPNPDKPEPKKLLSSSFLSLKITP
jgi:hypothetical protein